MCGIAGIYKLNDTTLHTEILKRFTDSMNHRGPDGSGYKLLEKETIGLGHRRLSILDISENGDQPMNYQDERYWIIYNGEIFNFEDIKSELLKKGYIFKSESDTEVILASFCEWGKGCLNKFNGMWAFAIWDNQTKELFLARDRFGIKPLYYLHIPDFLFAFASETRAFKYLDGYERTINEELLQANLLDPYSLEGIGYTIFNNIYQLLPGHYMIVKRGSEISQERWWHIQDHLHQEVPKTVDEQAERFYELFRDACRIRLISDVPVATALSGGLDSTAVYNTVYSIMQDESLGRVNRDSQRAFTAIFPGLQQDEKDFADKAVAYTGGRIQYVHTDFDHLSEQIERDTELCDYVSIAPVTSIASVYKGMREHGITVSMDGHGVDEMMYGYRDMIYSLYNDAQWNMDVATTRNYASVLSDLYHPDLRESVKGRFESQLQEKQEREKRLSHKLKKLTRVKTKNSEFLPLDLPSLSNKPYDFSALEPGTRMVYYEFFQHTLPTLLRNFDRAGMINSVEIRMPFMDWRLVTYVFSLPVTSKLGEGYTKLLLRKAMKNKMDESLRLRTYKVGIGSPVSYWFNNQLRSWAMDKVKSKALRNELERSIKQDNVISDDLSRRIWQEFNVELIR